MTPEFRHKVEVAHVTADMIFLRRLLQGIIDHQKHSSIASLCSFNYICLLTYEAARHIAKLPHEIISTTAAITSPVIAQARHSVKLFDDNKRGLAGVTGIIEDEIIPTHSQEFLGNTWLKWARHLESDLGLFTYQGKLIATTHSIQYNLGMSVANTRVSDLGPAVRDVATECSKFIDAIARDHAWQGASFLDHVNLNKIRSRDCRAEKEYPKRFDPAIPFGLTASLISFQASLNFLDGLLSTDSEPTSRGTVTKLKYVTLRHTYSSLQRIQDEFSSALDRRSRTLLDQTLSLPRDRDILAGADNRLRNVLVHYGLGKTPLDSVSVTTPLFGLIETFTGDDYTFDSFEQSVTQEVGRLSGILNDWSGA